MTQLKKHSPVRPVYFIDDRLPVGDLFLGRDAWGVDITLSHGGDLRRLRDNQASGCTLAVVRRMPTSEFAYLSERLSVFSYTTS